MSSQSRRKLVAWTVLGTLGCVVFSLATNILIFRFASHYVMVRVILSATIIPLVLAGPLFFFLSLKLRELATANKKLATLAATDSLTGCMNRRAFTDIVDSQLNVTAQAARPQGALLILDVDHFKRINDRFGHDQGDEALRALVRAIRPVLRQTDSFGRLGGEEFGIFMPGATVSDAAQIAERVRLGVAETYFAPSGIVHPLSISIGVATFGDRTNYGDLFRMADSRLYDAKAEGRDQVKLVRMPTPESHAAMLH